MLEGWRIKPQEQKITAGRVQLFAVESPNKRTPLLLALRSDFCNLDKPLFSHLSFVLPALHDKFNYSFVQD